MWRNFRGRLEPILSENSKSFNFITVLLRKMWYNKNTYVSFFANNEAGGHACMSMRRMSRKFKSRSDLNRANNEAGGHSRVGVYDLEG